MKISICIPCYNAEKNISKVVEKVISVMEERDCEYEIVLVNDGSSDDTFLIIKDLCRSHANVIGIDLTKNFGQASAKLAALKYAEGDVVVFMDDDGQHPAECIYMLVDKLSEGYDVVYGYFPKKKHSLFKRVTSNLHKYIAEMMGNKAKGVHTSPFVAWNKTVVDEMKKYHSPFVSIGGYINRVTTKFGEVEVPHLERISGKSGYSLKKLIKVWKDIFFSFSMVPLQIITLLGCVTSIMGFLGAVALFVKKMINPSILLGYTSTNIIILLMGGFTIFSIGIASEYIGRIYMTISDLPQYTIREMVSQKENDC